MVISRSYPTLFLRYYEDLGVKTDHSSWFPVVYIFYSKMENYFGNNDKFVCKVANYVIFTFCLCRGSGIGFILSTFSS